ncbi:hypothetical protein DE146DRAFT_777910 [Phaeosphaeria sp. MPI-PUGE-AT-0046c]|nr:hypothetical protein DE146DRAFT_777910 [Phaeosphaeria sp. MPI-PUGE-AT-0046c]
MSFTRIIALALTATFAAFAHPSSPASLSALAIVSGTPFAMHPSSLMARPNDWASPATPLPTPPAAQIEPPALAGPVIATAPVPAPAPSSPTYTWAETHDDSKNTHTHEIIAASVVGIIFGLGLVVCAAGVCFRTCRSGTVKDRGMRIPDVEGGVVPPLKTGRGDGAGTIQPVVCAA